MNKYGTYILLSLCILIGGGLLWLQHDSRVRAYIATTIKAGYEQATGCDFDFTIKSINLLDPHIILEQVKARPKNGTDSWQWQCDTCTIHFSWIKFLLYRSIGLHITLDNFYAATKMHKGSLAIIEEHIIPLTLGPSTTPPLYLKSIAFHNGTVLTKNSDIQTDVMLRWSSESKMIGDIFRNNIYVKDGTVVTKSRSLAKNLAGTVHMDISHDEQGAVFKVHTNCTGDLSFLPNGKQYTFIVGSFEKDQGTFSIKTPDQSCVIENIVFSLKNNFSVDATARMSVQTASELLNLGAVPVEGQCTTQLHVATIADDYTVHASVLLDALTYNTVKLLDHIKLDVHRDSATWQGTVQAAALGNMLTLQGAWQWHEKTGKGTADLHNAQLWLIPQLLAWNVAPNHCQLHLDFDDSYRIDARYAVTLSNPITDATLVVHGSATVTRHAMTVQGMIGDAPYTIEIPLLPHPYLKKMSYANAQGEQLVSLQTHQDNPQKFLGMFRIPFIRRTVRSLTNYDVQGEGALHVQGMCTVPHIQCKAFLNDAVIRLPGTHNFVSDFSADVLFDMREKKIMAENVACKMHRGVVKAESAHATFDDSYNITSFSLPITLDSCLLNVKKDVFAMLSGSLDLHKKEGEKPLLQGKLLIDRSVIHENLFSDKVQKAIFSGTSSMFDTNNNELMFDVVVETKNPIRINTAFVEAQAKIKLHIQDSLQNPKVTGTVDLVSGSLAFPYRPLNVVRGNIFFMPNQLYDPMIELVARNTIKKHTVTLNVTGSLLNPHVTLESNPSLTEEQIVGLLLVGSQVDSLNVAVPAIIMQNLKSVLFDSEHSPIKLSKLKSWLKPFKYINLVPSFSDQSGRGGLRGAIEIELNDRVHGLIQKNFSLSEDTKFEVEYALSDDVSLRAIRNERKDVGGEMEMRWKFGS